MGDVLLQPFVISTHQRCGSNMLALALHSHPDAVCFGEIFRQGVPQHRQPRVPHRPNKPSRYLGEILGIYQTYSAVGFKLMWRHSDRAHRLTLDSPHWAKILLTRENVLAQYASKLHAKKSGRGVVTDGKSDKATRLTFDAEDFEAYWQAVSDAYEPVRRSYEAGVGHWLKVEYADLVKHGFGEVQAFLGLEPLDLASGTQKRQGSDVAGRFQNWDAVYRYLDKIDRPDWAHEAA